MIQRDRPPRREGNHRGEEERAGGLWDGGGRAGRASGALGKSRQVIKMAAEVGWPGMTMTMAAKSPASAVRSCVLHADVRGVEGAALRLRSQSLEGFLIVQTGS